jgi:hypothetical protein
MTEEKPSGKQNLHNATETSRKKLRVLILVPVFIALALGCFFCGLRAVRFFRHFPKERCYTDAEPGDTIYTIIPLSYPEAASNVPLGMIELPQSMEHFGSVCLYLQGGETVIWFELDDDELDEFLVDNSIDSLSEPAPTVPGFGPTLWQRSRSAYQYAIYHSDDYSLIDSQVWLDDRRNNTVRVYIRVFY